MVLSADASKESQCCDFASVDDLETISLISTEYSACSHFDESDTAQDSYEDLDDLQDAQSSELPDFSGRWVFRRHEGDFDAMMIDAGTAWATRRLAKAMGYGAGLVVQVIEHSGEILTINFRAGTSSYMQRLHIGELDGQQSSFTEDGDRACFRCLRDGNSLSIDGYRLKDGSKLQSNRRYMLGDEMVQETLTSSGQIVKRFYAK